MVVIYTNENNPTTLKLIASIKYGKEPVELQIVNVADKTLPPPGHLPYVILSEDRLLSMSNAASKYFFQCSHEDEDIVNQWLDFESTELYPLLILLMAGGVRVPGIKSMLVNNLKVLNENLKNDYLNQKYLNVCDIAIWATLYPIFKDEVLCKEYLQPCPKIIEWMVKIENDKIIQESLNMYSVSSGIPPYQAMQAGAKYPINIPTSVESQISSSSQPETATSEEISAAISSWKKEINQIPKPKKNSYPVLPVPGEKNVLITAALPYVNNIPHLGNIVGCVLSSDVFARFSRLCNWNTLLIGGTDEYGTATETKALEEGLTPQQICDKYFDIHNNIYRWFNIGFDYFGRTTTPDQTKIVQDLFLTLNKNGFMHTQSVDQLLCEKCKRYLADRFVEGGCPHPGCGYDDARGDQCDGCGKLVNATELVNPRCKVCRSAPVLRSSEQFFLDLPKLEPLLFHWMEKSEGWTNNAKVITKSWMKEGLKPRCITRDLKWGVPVPLDGFRDKVFYVWFDAPIGYISITSRYTKEWQQWWQPSNKNVDITLYQFMGKDNVPFHSVMFPACLLGANQGHTLVSHIMATEYLNYEDGKFSKSRGVGVFGNDAQNTGIPSDVWRFYLLYLRPEGQDSSFSWVDLATKNNSELLNNLGNFINRALVFAEKFFNSTVPEMNPNEDDYKVLALCTRELKGYMKALEICRLRDGIRHILAISKHGNQYLQSTQPWVLLKGSDEERTRAGTIIGICVNLSCLLATLMFPYMPESSRKVKKQLNAPDTTSVLTPEYPEIVKFLAAGHKIGKPAPLFDKIEPAFIEEMKKKYGGAQQPATVELVDIAALEKQIKEQGDEVRAMKASGAAKEEWQPKVNVLLNLKKKLETAQKALGPDVKPIETTKPATDSTINSSKPPASENDIKILEQLVEKQGNIVRKFKESGISKAELQPHIDKLLELKGTLALATGKPLAAPGKGGKKGKK